MECNLQYDINKNLQMKTTRWLLFSLAGIFLPYGDCNPGEVGEIKTMIQAKSLLMH